MTVRLRLARSRPLRRTEICMQACSLQFRAGKGGDGASHSALTCRGAR